MKQRTVTIAQWKQEGRERFGPNTAEWRFVCPACGHVASVQEWGDAGATEGQVAFSCIGRLLLGADDKEPDNGPCRYAGGGLFRLNPVTITHEDGTTSDVFEFAEGGW